MKTIEEEILAFAESQWGMKTYERLGIKLAEECGEVCRAVVKWNEGRASREDFAKELGDALIVLSQFAAKEGRTLHELVLSRFTQIKDRAKPIST